VNHQLRQLWRQAEANGDSKQFDLKVLKAGLNKVVITKALISLIVVQNLSYCLVEWPEFHTLCQALNQASKGAITTSHSGVQNKVSKA
jgi:hypothetical protein